MTPVFWGAIAVAWSKFRDLIQKKLGFYLVIANPLTRILLTSMYLRVTF